MNGEGKVTIIRRNKVSKKKDKEKKHKTAKGRMEGKDQVK